METQGGAAIAAGRLAEALCQSGHRVTRLVAAPDGQGHVWQTHKLALSFPLPLHQRLTWHALNDAGREKFGNRLLRERLERLLADLRPDVINAHNLHLTYHPRWSPELLRACMAQAPTVWTLHDMWSFTGRCVYSYGCEKFVRGCDDECPTAQDYPVMPANQIARSWAGRRELLQDAGRFANIAAVTPSEWMAREAQKGLWAGRRVEVIPYGLKLDVYRPIDRAEARAALGLESRGQTGRTILFAAQNLTDPRKGWPILYEALRLLPRQSVTLLAIGNGELPERIGEVEVRRFSFVSDELRKALIYNAADLLVHPATADNAPLVVAESLACGLPVAGFDIGGVPEMVIPGRTGWIARTAAPEPLSRLLETALNDLERGVDLRGECRRFAEAHFNFARQAQLYSSLFTSLLSTRPPALRAALT